MRCATRFGNRPSTCCGCGTPARIVEFAEAVFVLHCFQKKSKSGIATPKVDMDIIRARLKVAEAMAQELRDAKTNH
ncbi:type II toxin-antitoxin system RelE/ParE family toxin [Pseudothauera rhizosphaerae]|nr:type II toxin-antitoxin system RelE/ParE family toxin [Pseudothauera rhizosphaerae]